MISTGCIFLKRFGFQRTGCEGVAYKQWAVKALSGPVAWNLKTKNEEARIADFLPKRLAMGLQTGNTLMSDNGIMGNTCRQLQSIMVA
jgi:hypothetical protein